MKDEFLALYKEDFEITGGGKMETFLGMAVEQKDKSIRIHLDNYIKDVLTECSDYIKKSLWPKKVPISPGVVFRTEDIPDSPDPRKQKQYRSFVAKLQFAATWIRFDISFVVSQLARFVYQRDRLNGQLYTILWNILRRTPASKYSITRV